MERETTDLNSRKVLEYLQKNGAFDRLRAAISGEVEMTVISFFLFH